MVVKCRNDERGKFLLAFHLFVLLSSEVGETWYQFSTKPHVIVYFINLFLSRLILYIGS